MPCCSSSTPKNSPSPEDEKSNSGTRLVWKNVPGEWVLLGTSSTPSSTETLPLGTTATPIYDASEQDVVLKTFSKMLWEVTKDGGKKRSRGEKPEWWRDKSHEAAIWSHVDKWKHGEKVDKDSGVHPLVHLAWRALAIAYQETKGMVDPNPPASALQLNPACCQKPDNCKWGGIGGCGEQYLPASAPEGENEWLWGRGLQGSDGWTYNFGGTYDIDFYYAHEGCRTLEVLSGP